ncbi:MAG: ubiquinone/menaquinone biosynthesis methyltransferase [Caldimicrobium sp.]|nr:ubiquinone/menaquinone biosynthesis methyltransferase [Caldimicrobium sp.]MCX7873085.1 ubiquinone/menaquinone biosynthesis methyltransferase [Caldimicrobium sp.]MDW8094510.1 ubiquinone/menaquinone biosynthesis methyltransferase [Caldimicrobium sp.]
MSGTKKPHKKYLEEKFDHIVRFYDLVNSLLSFNQDRAWRKRVVQLLNNIEGPILDLCCGPFTLSVEIINTCSKRVFALDLSFNMLKFGLKRSSLFYPFLFPIRADAERLPFKEAQFSAITLAFGLRNLSNLSLAISEFHRVLKEEGLLLILEFSMPVNPIIKAFYIPYLRYLVPLVGGLITKDREAYQYLANSIQRFPPPQIISQEIQKVGFQKLSMHSLTFGVVTLYVFKKIKTIPETLK